MEIELGETGRDKKWTGWLGQIISPRAQDCCMPYRGRPMGASPNSVSLRCAFFAQAFTAIGTPHMHSLNYDFSVKKFCQIPWSGRKIPQLSAWKSFTFLGCCSLPCMSKLRCQTVAQLMVVSGRTFGYLKKPDTQRVLKRVPKYTF